MICVPWLLFYTIYLLILFFIEYLRKAARILTSITFAKWRILYFPVWVVIGLPYMLFLAIQDLGLVFRRVTDFQDTNEPDLYTIRLSQHELTSLNTIFNNIYKLATIYVERGVLHVNLKEMVYELGRLYSEQFSKEESQEDKDDTDSECSQREKSHKRHLHFNRNAYMFHRKYNTKNISIYSTVLQKFVTFDEKGANQDIDLPFLIEKIKNNLEESRVLSLVSFHKGHLESARRTILSEEKVETKQEFAEIKEMITELQFGMQQLFRGMTKMQGQKSNISSSSTSQI